MLYLDYAKQMENGYILNFFADSEKDIEEISDGKKFVTLNGTDYGAPMDSSTVAITMPDKTKKTFVLNNGNWIESANLAESYDVDYTVNLMASMETSAMASILLPNIYNTKEALKNILAEPFNLFEFTFGVDPYEMKHYYRSSGLADTDWYIGVPIDDDTDWTNNRRAIPDDENALFFVRVYKKQPYVMRDGGNFVFEGINPPIDNTHYDFICKIYQNPKEKGYRYLVPIDDNFDPATWNPYDQTELTKEELEALPKFVITYHNYFDSVVKKDVSTFNGSHGICLRKDFDIYYTFVMDIYKIIK